MYQKDLSMAKTYYRQLSRTERKALATLILTMQSGTDNEEEHDKIAERVRLLDDFHVCRIINVWREIIIDYSGISKIMRLSKLDY